ncbi:FG-GAP and VCBS repeat-containing protein [Streptomyces sp. WMMC500]|uniref:FG-GAP and VCBS repeat-containing protein n=1 Tax=Streptomyces sp. WMMC500 TaxID=3015154 RepID=UPI00248B5099|nr:FG-GAP and VCBS repeat-containing protein [Streptomyces sp. WMMC500]WBB64325.1 FG-GAP and VCBS repeat-containing protein [Streptomyces sp. WMMC500]
MRHPLRTALAAATAAAVTGGLLAVATAPGAAAAEPPGAVVNFNGDGVRDAAVSAPGAYVAGVRAAGQVVAHYGTKNDGTVAGISGSRAKRLSQHSAGVPGTAEDGDGWGGWTAAADYDGDGYTDLAVAAPGEAVGGDVLGGTVQLLWGGPSGLAGGTTLPDPRPYDHDLFGHALAAGDFDGDGAADLAVASTSASVDVFTGGFGRTKGDYGVWDTVAVPLDNGKIWGPHDLAAGDVDGDGADDLVVAGSVDEAYRSTWVPGSADGLTGAGQRPVPGGETTVTGDVDGDGRADIVTGLARDDATNPGAEPGGKVFVTLGSAAGPAATTELSQATPGVPGTPEQGDSFGGELALGDADGDGHTDLAVAAANETLGDAGQTGTVTVLRGAADGSGFGGAGATLVHQNAPGVPGTNETRDRFGTALLLADLNGDGVDDLTVGTAGEDAGDGAVYALRSDAAGAADGAAADGAVAIRPSSVGMPTAGRPGYGAEFAG